MPSQFFGLNIAYTGLLGANAGLNTTANNISNAQTEGFSRQEVNQTAAVALRTFTTYGCAGAGVDVLSIERIHDDFYDHKYWSNNTKAGEFGMKEYYMTQVETYFRDDDTIEGFASIFAKMMNALAEVKKNPANESTKMQFVGFADNLTQYFNNMANNMENVQKDINSELKQKVDEINSLASEIATINKQINVIELSGSRANELRDKRTLLVDQMSAIVDLDAREYPIVDSNNPERETGGHQFVITIAGGQTLVDSNDYRNLTCIARTSDEKVNQSDIDGLYDVYWVSNPTTGALGDKFNLYNILLGGQLQGLVEMRDGNNAENFRGTIASVGPSSGGRQTITIDVDAEYLKDLDKCTLPDTGGKIAVANKDFYYDTWTYSYDGSKYTYTFEIDNDMSGDIIPNSRVGKEAEVGQPINYQGVPYYQQQLNEWTRIFSNAFNSILESGYTDEGEPGILLFTGDLATGTGQQEFGVKYHNATGKNVPVTLSDHDDSYYRLTAKNFSVFRNLVNNSGLLATRSDKSSGVDDYSIIGDLITMTTDKDIASYRGAATGEFLTCVLSDVALNCNRAQTFHGNYENIGKTIDNQRISISGVDTDDEAVNLVKYQNSYTLASKMIQTLTEVYDRLILQTGV
ncbi:MAG: flagellar hook-associated protein FlgK [Lachnospiraceae bacterium]|nr:flagellar hook-associated protein FlgK [Lachnospiraceae bacterium]